MAKLKLNAAHGTVTIEIPDDLLQHMNVEAGDTVYAIAAEEGIRLVPYNSKLAKQLEVTEKLMAENDGVLRKLAK